MPKGEKRVRLVLVGETEAGYFSAAIDGILVESLLSL
jgi:hypothetical protein